LRPYERVLLTALFDAGSTSGEIRLSMARARFAAAVPVLQDRLHAAVAAEGFFTENPKQVRQRYIAFGVLLSALGMLLAFGGAWLLFWASAIIWLPGILLAIGGGVLAAMSQAMTRRTPRGALEAARWRAFRAHLANEQQHGPVDPHHLAYAVAFGMDRSFLHRLEQVGAPAPNWYGRGPVVIVPGGYYGGPGGYYGGSRQGSSSGPLDSNGPQTGGSAAGGLETVSPQGWSDALSGLLTAASEALSHGGGSGGWSGGSFGGGGGGGGGSGGFR